MSLVNTQCIVRVSSSISYRLASQKVAMPPDAPLELLPIPGPFFQKLFPAWRVADSSIFVSWTSRISGLWIRTKSFIASSFKADPRPLQFQEVYRINYFEWGWPLLRPVLFLFWIWCSLCLLGSFVIRLGFLDKLLLLFSFSFISFLLDFDGGCMQAAR